MKSMPPLLPVQQAHPGRLTQSFISAVVFMGVWTISSNCLGLHCHQTKPYFTQALLWWPNYFAPLLLGFPDNGFWTVFITATFIALITTLFLSVILYDLRRWRNAEQLQEAPRTFTLYLSENAGGIMTSLGILGTFLGLALGKSAVELSESPERVQFLSQHFQEIKKLMLTLSLAFWSSVAGIGGAIGVKIFKGLFNNFADQPTDMISVMDTHSSAVCTKLDSIDTSIKGQKIIPAQEIAEAISRELRSEFAHHFSMLDQATADCGAATKECATAMRASTQTFCDTMREQASITQNTIRSELNIMQDKFDKIAVNMDSAVKTSHETLVLSRSDYKQLHEEAKKINAQLKATTESYNQLRKEVEDTAMKLQRMVRNYRKAHNYDRELRDAFRKMGNIPAEMDRLHGALAVRMERQENTMRRHGYDPGADLEKILSAIDKNDIVGLEALLQRLLQHLKEAKESK